jgi:hypothetical protein
MEMGRILRRYRAIGFVEVQGVCYSSCIFLLAGAPYRIFGMGSRVGLHRPYSLDNTPMSTTDRQARHDQLQREIETYFKSMNVSARLYEAMVVVPPERLRIVSEDELNALGLASIDPIIAEEDDARQARNLGLTRQEYLSRKRLSQNSCMNLATIEQAAACDTHVLQTGRVPSFVR